MQIYKNYFKKYAVIFSAFFIIFNFKLKGMIFLKNQQIFTQNFVKPIIYPFFV